MSLSLTDVRSTDLRVDVVPVISPEDPRVHIVDPTRVIAYSAWHSLFWLVVANAIGVLLGLLLLVPSLNKVLGEWTYGRWMPVHTNLELYGWSSLPLVAFLFKAYGADKGPAANWCRPALWAWSCSARRRRAHMAKWTLQRKAVSRLDGVLSDTVSACDNGSVAGARIFSPKSVARVAKYEINHQRRKDSRSGPFACSSHTYLRCGEPDALPSDQPGYWGANWREPT